jgi:hypothetical protein
MIHQRVAREADEIDVAILGTVLRLKPAPIQLHDGGSHAPAD